MLTTVNRPAARERFAALIDAQLLAVQGMVVPASPRVARHPLRVLFDNDLMPRQAAATPTERTEWLLASRQVRDATSPYSARAGATFCRQLAMTLALYRLAPDPNERHEASATLRTVLSQTPPLLALTSADNPEPAWYHELLLLHLLASFAWQSDEPQALEQIALFAAYHQRETQPDHATAEPWGLHAFAVDFATHFTADQMLHACEMNRMSGPAAGTALHAVGLMALREALYSLSSPPRRTDLT